MKPRSWSVIALISLLLFMPLPSIAGDEKAREANTLTFYLENDALFKTDRYYTNGIKVSWISRDLSKYRDLVTSPLLHGIIERLPLINDPENQHTVSVSFGQSMYTPEDKERTDLITDDRPYAGFTYLGLGLHSRNLNQMDTFELDVGIIGPHSYAEDCQGEFHKWLGVKIANGWEHQLNDEPIVNLYYERKWKTLHVRSSEGFGFDCIPHVGLALGNAYTGANLGGQVRFGWNIPNDFGTFLIRPGSDSSSPLDDTDPRFFSLFRRIGVHLFFGVDGKAVARDILLDGNTFRDSHSVDKEPFVADFIGGVGVIIHRVKITYSHVYRTKEFETQKDEQHFGAIAASFTF
jgi:hypothetical protein